VLGGYFPLPSYFKFLKLSTKAITYNTNSDLELIYFIKSMKVASTFLVVSCIVQ